MQTKISESQVISLVITMATILAAGAALVGWAYETFEPKEIAREKSVSSDKRLERIENKIDALFERLPQRERH